jgi:hypothetical protein
MNEVKICSEPMTRLVIARESFIRNAAVRISKYYNTIDRPVFVFAFVVRFTTVRFRFTKRLQQFRPTGQVGLGKETSIDCLESK